MTDELPAPDPINWVASWGDQIRLGDLVKVSKLGGPVKVTQLRRFIGQQVTPYGEPPWYFGLVVENTAGQQFHLAVQPQEAVFIAPEVPAEFPIDDKGEAEGSAPDGVDD